MISKIISQRLKDVISKHVSPEQFGFLESRQIHEVVGVAQDGPHSVKTKNLRVMIAKVDLSKAFDRVSWLFLSRSHLLGLQSTLCGMGNGVHQFSVFHSLNQWGSLTFLQA
jgi:hypothetical protein